MITHIENHHFKETELYCLENDTLKIIISNIGASILSFIYKPLNRELVLGLKSQADMDRQTFYLCAGIGRVANRIAHGMLPLDQIYQLNVNNGTHHLHGGIEGFDRKHFQARMDDDCVILEYRSPHLEEYYPGNLGIQWKFFLDENRFFVQVAGFSDQDTLFDPTQHSYFNFNEDKSETILNHTLQINAKAVYAIDETGITSGEILDSKGTAFDFSQEISIDDNYRKGHPQFERTLGYDHYYLKNDDSLWFGRLANDDVSMDIFTTLPGAHVYSGNYLEPLESDFDYPFLQDKGGICFETQHISNSVHFDPAHAPFLKADKIRQSLTIYEIKEKNI